MRILVETETMEAILSNMAIDIADKCGVTPTSFLKNAAIAYDRVFFYTGLFGTIEGLDLSNLPGLIASWTESDSKVAQQLEQQKAFRDIFPDAQELWPDLQNFNAYREIDTRRNRDERMLAPVRDIVARTFSVTKDEIAAGRIGETWLNIPFFVAQDFTVLTRIRERAKSLMGVFTEAHVSLLATDLIEQGIAGDPLSRLLLDEQPHQPRVFPDFGACSWAEIIELRSDARVSDFRRKLARLSSGDFRYERRTQLPLWQEYVADLESLATDVRPRATTSAIIGTLGNIPTPFPNPVSLLSAMFDFVDKKNRQSDYGWVYFIQSAKSMALRGPARPSVSSSPDAH
jgi:hypothetical protein